MAHLDIIRAWKDPEYRLSLSAAERAQLPAHPAGLIALTDAELDHIGGGSGVLSLLVKAKELYDVASWIYDIGKAALKAWEEAPPEAHDAAMRAVS
jgi:mersacidin/lichenicidin family type 2 lantibiotic